MNHKRRGQATAGSGETGTAGSSRAGSGRSGGGMVSVEEAQAIILNAVTPLDSEEIHVMETFNRILYEDIVSDVMVPPVDDSAMDGYAIIADDTRGASRSSPVKLNIVGEIQAGGSPRGKKVSRGTAIRIMTGAPIPEGADSVIQFEETEEEHGWVKVFSESAKYANCKRAGEVIRKGDKILQKGERLKSADIGILASINRGTVAVYRRPTVSIVSTGDELVEIGEESQSGKIRNINSYTLYSEVRRYNGLPHYVGIARDTVKDTREKFLKALESDVVISSGGVSMGKYDFVKEIFSSLGVEILFETVYVKPGRPFTFGRKGNKLIFGLPGYPVPTLTSFIQFVRPALLRLMGAAKINKPLVKAVLEEDIRRRFSGVNLVRGCFSVRNNEFYVATTGNQKPSVLLSMSKANCLIIVPERGPDLKAGDKVTIQLIEHDEI